MCGISIIYSSFVSIIHTAGVNTFHSEKGVQLTITIYCCEVPRRRLLSLARGVHGTVRFPPTQAMPTTQEQKLTLPSFDTPSLGSKSAYFSGNVYIIYPLYPAHTCRRDTCNTCMVNVWSNVVRSKIYTRLFCCVYTHQQPPGSRPGSHSRLGR